MDRQINIQEALDWYIWAGVDETCSDFPCLFAEEHIKQPVVAAPVAKQEVKAEPAISIRPFTTISKNAQELCAKAQSL